MKGAAVANTFVVGTVSPQEHLVKCLITRLGCDATGTDPAYLAHPRAERGRHSQQLDARHPRALIG